MYLKSIEVQGFKSFANKIKFEFHNGITGIVGPNGSGKSNVADAVRWVLGEQRVKQLRGGTMQDVIFSGTENRKPLSYASVAITLDNSDHKLPVEYEEVTVTRKLYRSGESEYLINGSACRLKDINEMFYDTGIGKEGYSIIGQGQIDKMVKKGEADAFVSAGSSGAVLVGGQVLVGRIKGVERPPLAPLIPTLKGVSLLIDCGANVDARPSHLVQFAKMGSIYMESVMGKKNPTVGIVNIGAEEEKGNALVKETFPLLKECPDINFIGSVEARDIPYGAADVIVCEAFAGNIILKLYEGVAGALLKKVKKGMLSSLRSKIGALLVKPALKGVLKDFDTSEYGGAPLLGLNGLVVKTHGSSKSKEVCNSIIQCVAFKEQKINEKIKETIQQETLEEKKEEKEVE